MSKLVKKAETQLRERILEAMGRAAAQGALSEAPVPAFLIEVPANRANGDYSSNVAMAGAKALRMAPRKVAEAIGEYLDLEDTWFERFEIAGPGFLNFFLRPSFYADVIDDVLDCGQAYGRSDFGGGKKIMVEFVSANPTGPMHMGNARGGALGDCLAAVLDAAGYQVTKEFYINDAGNQIDKFGLSLDVRYRQIFLGEDAVELPEDSYHGEDILARAREYAKEYGDVLMDKPEGERRKALVAYALPKNIQSMKETMGKYHIAYDEWFHESLLHEDGEVAATLKRMEEAGLTYEKDGATWYRATEHAGEKDEVLVRANGNPTYFLADIAYHRNKLEVRGNDIAIDIWGADHHGHVARMKGVLDALGLDGSRLHVVLMQLVRLTRDGEVVRMSKRTGKAITLNDLLEEIPVDAVRFLFNMREASSQMDFDLDLAVEQSAQNPVYYVQYAHARIHSLISKLQKDGVEPRRCTKEELLLLTAPEEIELIRHLSMLTDEIVLAAKKYDPARITRYVIELATLFHKFYNACRVAGEAEGLMHARLELCLAVRDTIRNVLGMLGVAAPESM